MSKKYFRQWTPGQIALGAVLFLYAMACLLPMVLVIIVSFSSNASVRLNGFSFFPSEWSLNAYSYIGTFQSQVIQSYKVTILITLSATLLGLTVMSAFAYALSREEFPLRRFFSIFILITMLFSGGLLAAYLVNTSLLHLRDSLLVLILPCIGAMNIVILRTFIRSNIPDALVLAARIDGAGEFRIYWQIVLPMMLPALAAVGFMTAVGHWNEWMGGFIYIDSADKTPLQVLLMRMERDIQYLSNNEAAMTPEMYEVRKNMPKLTARMALLVVVTGPIMIAYPFFQRFFIKGLTVGSIKG